jgi:hypothetical protein
MREVCPRGSVPIWLRLWAAGSCQLVGCEDGRDDVAPGALLDPELLGGSFLFDGLAWFLDGGASWGLVCHSSLPGRW